MSIERGIRSSIHRPYPEGYRVPGTRGINVDRAQIDLKKRKGFLNPLFYGDEEQGIGVPQAIKLKVFLEPKFIEDKGPLATYAFEGENFKSCHIYDSEGFLQSDATERANIYAFRKAVESVSISSLGYGEIDDKRWVGGFYFKNGIIKDFEICVSDNFESEKNFDEFDFKRTLYRRNFLLPNTPSIVVNVMQKNGVKIVDPPGLEEGYPLWPYAGTYGMGDKLENIEQLFFTPKGILDSPVNLGDQQQEYGIGVQGRTTIHLLKASFLHSQGIRNSVIKNSQNTKPYEFMEQSNSDSFDSLYDDLRYGKIAFYLKLRGWETEQDSEEWPAWRYVAHDAEHFKDNEWIFKFKLNQHE